MSLTEFRNRLATALNIAHDTLDWVESEKRRLRPREVRTVEDAITEARQCERYLAACMSFLRQKDADLAIVVAAWTKLPEHIRAAILTMVEAARVPSDDSE